MSLLRVSALRGAAAAAEASSSSPSAGGPSWLPSHVQVTVGATRGLRLKGGPGDAFAVLQLGRQKLRTSVATLRGGAGAGAGEAGGPRWGEECALELPPAALDEEETDAAALLLQVTVWQRALVGLDRFLGRALVPLRPLLRAGRAHPEQWHRLHSKPGKKEKERGEIQLSFHFTRHSLTASMFDLSVKDKPRSPFGRLRDKMKGRRGYDLESASAIVPSSSGATLEEDLGLGGKKPKGGGGGFFFKNRLRKSSLTQSSTSLGSDSTVSSAGSMVGTAASEAGAAPSPSRHGSLPADPSVRDFLPSPKLTHKRAFSDEVSQISTLPTSRSVQSLKPQSEPISRSSLCINGSHIYCEEPSPRPAACPSSTAAAPLSRPKKPVPESFSSSSTTGPPAPESELPPWPSSGFQRPPQKDPPRFIPSPPILAAQEEDKLSVKTLALHKHRSRAKMGDGGAHAEGRPVQVAVPMVFSAEAGQGRPPEEAQQEEKRAKAGLFRWGGTKEDAGKSRAAESAGHAGGPEGEKSGSWFSMKDAQDPSQRPPSSQSGPLAATEVTKDPGVCSDRGPPAFLRAGPPQPGPAPPSTSAFEPAAATGPPPEWADPFDAFATSRLRPGAERELRPLHWDPAASEGLAHHSRPEEEEQEEGSLPHLSAGPPLQWPSEPGRGPGVDPAETWGGVGESLGEQPWGSSPGPSPLGAPEGDAISGASLQQREEPPPLAEAEAADLWGEAWGPSAAGAPPPFTASEGPFGQAGDSHASPSGSGERSSPTESKREALAAALPLGRGQASEEAEAGEGAALQVPPAPPGQEPAPGKEQPPEEAVRLGSSSVAEGRGGPSESRGQAGEGGQGAEAAPPKPPRRFTPLSLEEEANKALGGAWPRCESQEGPVGGGSAPWAMGAAGGSLGRGAEGLPLPAADDGPARANEPMRQAGPWGDSELAAEEGAGGPEQPGLAGEPPSALSSEPGSSQGPGPSGASQGPEPNPSMLFWTALEEQLRQSQDGASPEQPAGLVKGTPEQEGQFPLFSPEAGQAPSACPRVLASGRLREGPGGSPASHAELSSSWSDDRVVDFKKADFWQAERGEEGSSPPGSNPFVSRVSPQNNPFVERPPGALPALRASPAKGPPSFRDLHAEAAPQGLLPAPLSQDQPAAPLPHDNQPLAFSTPSLEEEEEAAAAVAVSSCKFDFPSPIVTPAPAEGSPASGLSPAIPSPSVEPAASSALPVETRPADGGPVQRTTSPHLVRPLSTLRPLEKQRRSSLPLGQEKLKPKPTSTNDSATPILPLEKTGLKRDPPLPDGSKAKYLHLTHEELVQLVLKREAELSKKQEHIRELENYIDRLLVRIMEQSPTLLQIPLGGGGARAAR